MSQRIRAWRLDWPPLALALPLCEVIEIVATPEIHPMPFGPRWCRALLWWREQFIPLAQGAQLQAATVVVVAYQAAPGAPLEHAAFALSRHPQQIEVDDTMDCELETHVLPAHALLASFEHQGATLVVPQLARLFEVS